MTDTTETDHAGADGSVPEPPAHEPEEPSENPPGSAQTGRPEQLETPDRIDRSGWLLVALVVLCFLVIPLFVLYIPEAHWLIGRLGFSQRQAYIVFPMLPAVLLGLTAVWVTIRAYTN
jgi:hypothetical protein